MSPEAVELETPSGLEWAPVIRLVVGGFADRAHLRFDELDDLQLAIERLLAEAEAEDRVRLSFELVDGGAVRLRVGPLNEQSVAAALRDSGRGGEELNLRRVLDTVVDSFDVEGVRDGKVVVRLDKLVPAREA